MGSVTLSQVIADQKNTPLPGMITKLLFVTVLLLVVSACGGGSSDDNNRNTSGTPTNTPPLASTVVITDINGGNAEIGDMLTGTYTYLDAENDLEGASTFRWLRNGTEISGAASLNYTLVLTDSGQSISFEVTPRAVSGTMTGNPGISTSILVSSFNPGNVNFSDSGQSLGSSDSTSIAVGDLNSDGHLDIAVTNINSGNRIYTNNGSGTFTSTGQSLGSTDISWSVALGDIDGDNDLDMVVANNNGGFQTNDNTNRVYINNGSGNFTDSGQTLGTNNSWSIAMGDLDGDDDLDIVAGNDTGNTVYFNDGSGVFTDSGQSLGVRTSVSIALGDVDGDNDLDIVVANRSASSNKVYINDGTGIFTDSGQALGISLNSQSVSLGDIDGDSDLDVVIGNNSNNPNRVYINDGAGTFTDTGQSLGSSSSVSTALGDLDNDGDLDLVVVNEYGLNSTGNHVYVNDGMGSFYDSGMAIGDNNSNSVVVGDVDGDGNLDIIVANRSTGNRVYLNQN